MQGLGRKRGRYKGVWRERWFLLRGDVLAYWECEADMHRGEKHRGEHTVVSARAVDDAPEEPYCVALHVGLGGLLRSRVQEEFIGFPTDAERDAWLAALAAAHPAGADDETDDDVWVDLDRRPRQRTDVETAVVYDYSVVRSGWRVRVLYHIQVTESGTRGGDPEPWSIRKAQSDFRALLAALPPAVAQAQARDRPEGLSLAESFAELGRGAQDDDAVGPGMDRRGDRRGPMNKPTRLLSSALLARRVRLLNDVLAYILRDESLRSTAAVQQFLQPDEARECDVQRAADDDASADGNASDASDASSAQGFDDALESEAEAPAQKKGLAPPPSADGLSDANGAAAEDARGPLYDLVPTPAASAAVALAAAALASRVYAVPGALLVAIFVGGIGIGASLVQSSARKAEAHRRPRRGRPEAPAEAVASGKPTPNLRPWPRCEGHCFSEPQAECFRVRGESYLTDRVKVPSKPPLFGLLGVDLFLTDVPQQHIATHAGAFIQRLRARDFADSGKKTFCLNFCMGWGNFIIYWQYNKVESNPDAARTAFDKFAEAEDDAYRLARLKLIPRVVEGNWLVRRAVGGGGSAAKLAEALSLSFFKGDDYFEVDCDIVGSPRQSGVWDCWASAAGRGVFEPVQF
mmetsp:Transcript_19871/g.68468  ORF Transcript_19871/g.68468 Transcript_19871/m.68468 type:complete len:634 (+) Transcript_19871:67-1968(+)